MPPASTTPLDAFKAAFDGIDELPCCTGIVPLYAGASTLFYRTGSKANFVDFANVTDAELSSLSAACQQATFGVNKEDVLDESYRKAGKIDASDFSTQFSPFASGIMDTIGVYLLEQPSSKKVIKAELYKLNVYGPGSFFKAHVDTPRSDAMFGSLVVVLPTAHEGGALLFRHEGQEAKFDTAAAVSSPGEPHAAFVAFYSDVEHEVSLVTKGYRVTLTYNLYLDKPSSPSDLPRTMSEGEDLLPQMQASLSALLADPDFLPDGGLLGFGFAHKYAVSSARTRPAALEDRLKGSDATMKKLCTALSLDVDLKAIYTQSESYADHLHCFLDEFTDLDSRRHMEYDVFDYLHKHYNATVAYDIGEDPANYEGGADPIVWIKPLSKSNSFETPYVAYGNDAMETYMYSDVCLIARIASAKVRKLD